MKPEEYSRRQQELAGWQITIETYKLGDVYHCTISNVDPGARFARAHGSTREEAETRASEKATRYLQQARKFPVWRRAGRSGERVRAAERLALDGRRSMMPAVTASLAAIIFTAGVIS